MLLKDFYSQPHSANPISFNWEPCLLQTYNQFYNQFQQKYRRTILKSKNSFNFNQNLKYLWSF